MVAGVVMWLGLLAGAASAQSVSLCVPTSGSVTAGACGGGGTTVALPANVADQQTLISILPYVSFSSSGVGGKPTITFKGVNVQLVNGAGRPRR
jgi:hypothetical protein